MSNLHHLHRDDLTVIHRDGPEPISREQKAFMSAADALRFYNGMVAACANPAYSFSTSAVTAGERIGEMMAVLGEHGMTATIGFNGTAIIKPLRPVEGVA